MLSSESQKQVFARLWQLKCGTALFAAEKLLSYRSRIKCKQEPWEASPSLTARINLKERDKIPKSQNNENKDIQVIKSARSTKTT